MSTNSSMDTQMSTPSLSSESTEFGSTSSLTESILPEVESAATSGWASFLALRDGDAQATHLIDRYSSNVEERTIDPQFLNIQYSPPDNDTPHQIVAVESDYHMQPNRYDNPIPLASHSPASMDGSQFSGEFAGAVPGFQPAHLQEVNDHGVAAVFPTGNPSAVPSGPWDDMGLMVPMTMQADGSSPVAVPPMGNPAAVPSGPWGGMGPMAPTMMQVEQSLQTASPARRTKAHEVVKEPRRFVCEICGHASNRRWNYEDHVRRHDPSRVKNGTWYRNAIVDWLVAAIR
ncbi:hypothetical protein A0H81_07688 [Grifola frondosa]|uniref:C2H2-type domain-containing protein n=1 Tax=Grifola frondosa TaxID=5627 RepID=A0A1C7M8C8_GRIFR|nr:hypothetical protein A0H81_07688 [Grifola frondosa]